jgi:hypothetical protein
MRVQCMPFVPSFSRLFRMSSAVGVLRTANTMLPGITADNGVTWQIVLRFEQRQRTFIFCRRLTAYNSIDLNISPFPHFHLFMPLFLFANGLANASQPLLPFYTFTILTVTCLTVSVVLEMPSNSLAPPSVSRINRLTIPEGQLAPNSHKGAVGQRTAVLDAKHIIIRGKGRPLHKRALGNLVGAWVRRFDDVQQCRIGTLQRGLARVVAVVHRVRSSCSVLVQEELGR